MADTIINREIVNGFNNTVNIETTTDAELSLNGINNTINQSISLEGEFSVWNQIESLLLNVGSSSPHAFFTGNNLAYTIGNNTTIYDIDSSSSTLLSNTSPYINTSLSIGKASIMNKYLLSLEGHQVLKNGVPIQTFNIPVGYSMIYSMTISPDGKYICIVLFNAPNYFITLFKGA